MKTKPKIYTEEFVKKEVADLLRVLKNDKTICWVGELFESRNYSRQRYSEWQKAFIDNGEISDTIGQIDNILETRLVKGGLTGGFNATITKLCLTNNYDWQDKQELTGKGGLPLIPAVVQYINLPIKYGKETEGTKSQ